MTTAHNDDGPVSVPPPAGVWRCDAEGELSTRFRSFIEAQWEPPLSHEAKIVAYEADGTETVLAQAYNTLAFGNGWKITMAGAARINAEARGEDAA